MSKQYANPPLVEAICHIVFKPAKQTDEFFASFYEAIKADYPNIREDKIRQVSIEVIDDPEIKSQKEFPQLLYTHENERFVIRCLPHQSQLSIHAVKPYLGWDTFSTEIRRVLNVYLNLAQESEIATVSLHYLNNVNIGNEINYANFKETFTLYPVLPFTNKDSVQFISNTVEIPAENGTDTLVVSQATLRPLENLPAPVRFELLYISTKLGAVSVATISEWLEQAHEIIEKTFEDSITEAAKLLLNKN